MAKTGKKSTSPSEGQVEIHNLMTLLALKSRRGVLCSVGKERLQWWASNALNLKDVKSAVNKWSSKQQRAFFAFFDIYPIDPVKIKHRVVVLKKAILQYQTEISKLEVSLTDYPKTKGKVFSDANFDTVRDRIRAEITAYQKANEV